MDPYLPSVDLHGMRRDQVAVELDQLVGRHPGQCVRVVFGAGTGALADEVAKYLRAMQGNKKFIEGFLMDPLGANCVIKVA